MEDEELASLNAIAEAALKWTEQQHRDDSFTRIEWKLVEAVEALTAIKVRERKEREGR